MLLYNGVAKVSRELRDICVREGVFDRLVRVVELDAVDAESIEAGLREYPAAVRQQRSTGCRLRLKLRLCADREPKIALLVHVLREVRARRLQVSELDVQCETMVGDAGVREIARHLNGSLKVLRLPFDSITDAGALEIAAHCRALQHIDLAFNQIGKAGVGAIVRECADLRVAWLGRNILGKSFCSELTPAHCLSALTDLSLSGNPVGDEGLLLLSVHFRRIGNLTTLGLGNANLTPASALAFRAFPKLEHLEVSINSIGDEGAGAIAANCRMLRSLFISENGIGVRGAEAIADGLPRVGYLDISTNDIQYEVRTRASSTQRRRTALPPPPSSLPTG